MDAAKYHSLRTYQQVQAWLGNELLPSLWGWSINTRGVLPISTTRNAAPDDILKIVSCKCSKGCSTGSCSTATICLSPLPSKREMSALGGSERKLSLPSLQNGTKAVVFIFAATRSRRSEFLTSPTISPFPSSTPRRRCRAACSSAPSLSRASRSREIPSACTDSHSSDRSSNSARSCRSMSAP